MRNISLIAKLACALVLGSAFAAAQTAPAQGAAKSEKKAGTRPSPHETVAYTFADGKKITISYGRPHTHDPRSGEQRKVMGGLVPYGKPWRTGADEATTFVTDTALDVGGTKVPAGEYTLYTLPDEGAWKLIISKKTGQWGIPYPGEQYDFARIDMKRQSVEQPVEQFTISLAQRGPKGGTLRLEWENTRASVDFSEASQ